MSQQAEFQQPEPMNYEEKADNPDRREQSSAPQAQSQPSEYAAAPPLTGTIPLKTLRARST